VESTVNESLDGNLSGIDFYRTYGSLQEVNPGLPMADSRGARGCKFGVDSSAVRTVYDAIVKPLFDILFGQGQVDRDVMEVVFNAWRSGYPPSQPEVAAFINAATQVMVRRIGIYGSTGELVLGTIESEHMSFTQTTTNQHGGQREIDYRIAGAVRGRLE
jgi:hypothetical protein